VEATQRYKAELEGDLSRREINRKSLDARKFDDRSGMRQDDIRRGSVITLFYLVLIHARTSASCLFAARALEDARLRKVAELRSEGVTDAALRATGLI
jgi:hypothetical protein